MRPNTRNPAGSVCRPGGFTLVEMAIACGLIVVFTAGAILAMNLVNRRAQIARCETLALAVAQQRLDEIMTVSWQVSGKRPTLLASGTITESNLPLGNDDLNNQAGLSSAFTKLDLQVNATRTTEIANLTARTLRATVVVSFSYRNRAYTVSLTSIRATDTI